MSVSLFYKVVFWWWICLLLIYIPIQRNV